MSLFKNYEERYNQLVAELQVLMSSALAPLARLAAMLEATRVALLRIKEEVILHPFPTPDAEVYFFKHIKPKFQALKIYHKRLFTIIQGTPPGGVSTVRAYLEEELAQLLRWFRRHELYYLYHRLGATEFDTHYFLRSAEVPEIWLDELPELDRSFSSPLDDLFARIRAYEMLQQYLVDEMNRLDNPAAVHAEPAKAAPELQWTGDKVNLVEIIYGLYFTGQFNNGNADISLLIRFMEQHFKIDLSRTYRDFMDIRLRKKTSTTRFLDQMRDAILAHIDDDLALKKSRKMN